MQTSLVFVFSTALANEAADSVLQGRYENIISFHSDQPQTSEFLSNCPLKYSQLNGGILSDGPQSPVGAPVPKIPVSNALSSVKQSVHQQNHALQQQLGSCSSSPSSETPISSSPPLQGMLETTPIGSSCPGQPTNSNHTSEESQFSQQQSRIYIFSTALANKAADSVVQRQYENIISFHSDQPQTKEFLSKCPLKSSQMKGSISPDGPRSPINTPVPDFHVYSMSPVEQWVHQQNFNLQQQLGSSNNCLSSRAPLVLSSPPLHGTPPFSLAGPGSENECGTFPPLGSSPVSLMQSKVQDEALAPEQRVKREEQLASLWKIQQMLFPPQQGSSIGSNGQLKGPNRFLMKPHESPMGLNEQPIGANGAPMGHNDSLTGHTDSSMGHNDPKGLQMVPNDPTKSLNGPPVGPSGLPIGLNNGPPMAPYWDNMTPQQWEWCRLQQEFYTEKEQQQCIMANQGKGGPPPYCRSGTRHELGPQSPYSLNGGPEQLHPDLVLRDPQSSKGKRNCADEETGDFCRRMLPVPSPQQFILLNHFEENELTITKQLNLTCDSLTSVNSPHSVQTLHRSSCPVSV